MRQNRPCKNSGPLHQTDAWIVPGTVLVSWAVVLNETKFLLAWSCCACVSHVVLFRTHRGMLWRNGKQGERRSTWLAWRGVPACYFAEEPVNNPHVCIWGESWKELGPASRGECPSREPYWRRNWLCLDERQEASEARAPCTGRAVECVRPLRLRCDIQILSTSPEASFGRFEGEWCHIISPLLRNLIEIKVGKKV